MPEQPAAGSQLTAWLLLRSGPSAGARFPLRDGATRVGRAPDNDAVIDGPDAATVSLYHLEILKDGASCRVRDLNSTNGTWVNGERIDEAEVSLPATIRLGNSGPSFALVVEDPAPVELDRTVEISKVFVPSKPAPQTHPDAHHELLSSAVFRARRMRAHGAGGETMTIMRDVLEQALRYSRRRLHITGYSLLAAIVAVASVAIWRYTILNREKRAIDAQIQRLEAQLQESNDAADTDRLLSQLNTYQDQAQSLQGSLLYRLARPQDDGDLVTRELRALMAEFGAEVYSIPPEFIERVKYYIEQNQGPERPIIARALDRSNSQIETMRKILQQERLPPDLAYIPIVESALTTGTSSGAGAAGPWQFTAATARAYGLRVDAEVDERRDLVKSTRAGCKYLRDLILDFGAGSSVMLALAAYNSGTAKVKQAVTKTVQDPIKQRNFWYLYRARALPRETREYVPKVFAVILIGRNPQQFGF
jgi:pSer/pThr/pTyr-binding forkhead associated (FHA) protein/soluble lytic murein transglycosylase-like protein